MKWFGNVRKMGSHVDESGRVTYAFRGCDVVEPLDPWSVNDLVGQHIRVSFEGAIHCVVTGKPIRKTYGEGLSYDAFLKSPLACPSIIRPELSRIHEGIALRDEAWERANHLQPHVVYVSQTSGFKVGVTRKTNVPSRWVDQGAVAAMILAEVPYRQLAGEIEVLLKEHMNDRTNWRAMLKEVAADQPALEEVREACFEHMATDYEDYLDLEDVWHEFHFPVSQYPDKVKSAKLDKAPCLEGTLLGVKGQYWLFDTGEVWNVRSHAGYRVAIES